MLFRGHETDVLVVGAGPAGMLGALALAKAGVKCEIVDAQWRPGAQSYALALHPASLEILEEHGLVDDVVKRGKRVDRVAFYQGAERKAELDLGTIASPWPFVVVLSQHELEQTLRDALHAAGVEVRWNHRVPSLEVKAHEVWAEVERWEKYSSGYAQASTEWAIEKTWRSVSRFLVGADGHRSIVGKRLGVEYEQVADPELMAVFEFASDMDVGNEVRIVVHDGRPGVLWTLPDGHCRWSFGLEADRGLGEDRIKSRLPIQVAPEAFGPHLGLEMLRGLIEERAPWFDGSIGEIRWSLAVRFDHRLARRFGKARVWLVGDAAHLASPIGVQSMNVGLREANDLGQRLAAVVKGEADSGLLEQYEADWRAEWRELFGLGNELIAAPGLDVDSRRLRGWIPASGRHLRELLHAHGWTQGGRGGAKAAG